MLLDFARLCHDLNIAHIKAGEHHHCREGWIHVHCPFCANGHGWHLGYSLDHGGMHCWRCGGKTLFAFLREVINADKRRYAQICAEYSGGKKIREKAEKAPFSEKVTPPPGLSVLKPVHEKYLASRYLDPDLLKELHHAQGTAQKSGIWNWRVVVPVMDRRNNIVAYTGRAISPDDPLRWRTSSAAEISGNPKALLYGIQHIKDRVLILEGVSDVWRMGFGAVATMGIDWKKEQANILRKIKHRFILFDPEPIAQKRADELAHCLSAYPGETEILTGFKTDAGDFAQDDADAIMRELGFRRV
jgi:hypothetical protein